MHRIFSHMSVNTLIKKSVHRKTKTDIEMYVTYFVDLKLKMYLPQQKMD